MNASRLFKLAATVLLIVIATCVASAQQTQRELADYIRSHYTKREVYIPMRDGVKLFVCIYEPKDKDHKYPIMF
ncbi:MAG TPA: hypothetical protein VGP81_12155, partial [Pyrinomonadaceae bacterium]|nr:hypothetical protein [Pyrinomonadaceae bacterium]